MKREDLKQKTDAELSELLMKKSEELRNFRFATSGSKIKNVKTGFLVRKQIARILTEENARKKAVRA